MTPSPDQLRQYDTEGFFITSSLFDPTFTSHVSSEMDTFWNAEIERTGGPGVDRHPAGQPGFMISPSLRNSVVGDIFRRQELVHVYVKLLGPDLDLNYEQIVLKYPHRGPGAPAYQFAFHQDNYYALRGGDGENWDETIHLDPRKSAQGWMAFSETTLANGTLFTLPGAHRFGLLEHNRDTPAGYDCAIDPRIDVSKKIPVLLQPGQLLVFSGLLPHGSGANVSDTARKIIQFSISIPGGRAAPFASSFARGGRAVYSPGLHRP